MSTQETPAEQPSSPRHGASEPSRGASEPKDDQVASEPTPEGDSAPAKEAESSQSPEKEEEEEEDVEEGEVDSSAPPLPKEPTPNGPPLPAGPVPEPEDDGWDCQWDPATQAWFFHNRYTGQTQWDNPRVPTTASAAAAPPATSAPPPPTSEQPAAGGYNPAIHGDYDPNAWYAKGYATEQEAEEAGAGTGAVDPYATTAQFNRFTGQFQSEDMGPGRHTDDAKSRRQMNAFFDVDAAANAHDGRSLKAERSNKKPSKSELKQFKEKRRVRKEEKRRAWLRD